jgi:hypothetical protein
MRPEKATMAGRVLRFLPPPEHVPQPVDRMPWAVRGIGEQAVLGRVVRCTTRVVWLSPSMLGRLWLQQRCVTLLRPRRTLISAARSVESRGGVWRLRRGLLIKD